MLSVLAGLALCVPALTGTAFAQQGTAEIRGVVRDSENAIVPGVAVVVRNPASGMFRETTTNADGTYFIGGVTPGMYEVTATLTGFKTHTSTDVRLELGRTTTLDLTLTVGQLEEAVTVEAEAPIVDVTSKQIGGNVTSQDLTNLPSVNRNYIGFVGLLPGIIPNISTESFGSDSINVNGQDARNNNYMLDGASNNDDVIGQRAGTQARTPLEAIQEFQVITNQFDAEYGRTTGAVINAITMQGTNRFRGRAFVFEQDAALTTRDYFAEKNDLAKPDTQQQQFGGTFGGPIVKDRAHFFFSLERILIDEGVTVNITPRPEFNGTTTERTRVWNTLIRFDNQLNANHTWGVRWLREYSPQFNQLIPVVAGGVSLPVTLAASREENDLDQTLVGTLTSVFGSRRVNTLRVNWTQEDVIFGTPQFNNNGERQDQLPPTLQFQTFVDQQNNTAQARINNAYQIEDTFSWYLPGARGGDHSLKFGVQYQNATNNADTQDNLNGTFTFGQNNLAFDPANPRTYPDRFSIRVPGSLSNFTKAHFISAFMQDKWTPTNRLTINLGVRYDLEIVPVRELDNPRFASPDDYPVDGNNIAPRLGFAYTLDGAGRTVLRGGYGTFYDKTHFELIGGLFTGGVFSDSFVVTFPAAAADPGPRNGQMPTDPFLVNGPTVNRERLAQMFPAGSRQKNTGNVNLDNPGRRIPMTHQITLGLERQLASDMSLSVDYIRAIGRDLFIQRNLNPGLRATTAVTSPVVRIDPNFVQSVLMPENLGETTYDALQMQLEKRFSRGVSARAAYTFSDSRGNTGGGGVPQSAFQLLEDLHLELNDGPTDVDRRHNLVLSGQVMVPKTRGLMVSGIMRALSALPFTLTNDTIDPDRNGLNGPIDAGTYSGTGDDAWEVEYDGQRNGARGPGFFQVDLRLGYSLSLGGGRRLDLMGDIFNLANRANFANPPGNSGAPATFLRLAALRDGAVPRTAQFGARFSF